MILHMQVKIYQVVAPSWVNWGGYSSNKEAR